jgi:aspartate aminotransferase
MASYEYTKPKGVRSSPTMSAGQLAAKAKSLGVDIIVFTLGDLFPKPQEMEISRWVNQLKRDTRFAMRGEAQSRGYAPPAGLPAFLAAAAWQFSNDTGIEVEAASVRAGHGGKGTLTAAFRHFEAKAQPATVLLAAPGWPTNYDLFPAGTRMIEIDTQGRGLMSPAQLGEALKQYPEPDCIFINAPSNPTGANYTPDEREALLKLVSEQTKTSIVALDDPYGKLVFDREPYDIITVLKRGPVEAALFNAGRIAVFRTASKEYGMADSRVGWLVTRNSDYLTSVQNVNESEMGGVSGRAMEEVMAALLYGDTFITRTVAELQQKRQLLINQVGQLKFASAHPPQGTIYGWIDFAKLQGKRVPASAIATEQVRDAVLTAAEKTTGGFTIQTPADTMRYLAYVAGICPVQGTPFYAPGSPFAATDWHIRFTFCGEMTDLKKGLEQLIAAEAKLA